MQTNDCLNRQVSIEARVGEDNALDATPEEGIISINSHCGIQGTAKPSFLGYTITCVKVICVTGLPNKACPRLRDLATAPARGITQPRTNLIREPCKIIYLIGHAMFSVCNFSLSTDVTSLCRNLG